MKPLAAILPLAAACFAASGQQPNPPAQPAPVAQPAQSTPAQPSPAPTPPASEPNGSLRTTLSEAAQPLTPPAAPASLATVGLEGVSLSGSLSVENGLAFIGNNGAITAGDHTARVNLTRGGSLSVCASTKIHLSTDNTISGGGLMIAMDHGALEAHYLPGPYSDVILTPDLRILISGPGQTDLSLRVSNQGDTCVDNHGDHAPYVVASSLFEGGAYRVQPNQRVLFNRGSLQQVVDNEKESCGCPPPAPIPTPTTIVGVGAPGATLRSETQPTPPAPDQTSTAAQNPFPVAESEGLKPPPTPAAPVVPAGQIHTQVTVPLVYNGETAENTGMPASSVSDSGAATPASNAACQDPLFPGVVCDSSAAANQPAPQPGQTTPNPAAAPDTETATPKKKRSGFVRFLRKVFGG